MGAANRTPPGCTSMKLLLLKLLLLPPLLRLPLLLIMVVEIGCR